MLATQASSVAISGSMAGLVCTTKAEPLLAVRVLLSECMCCLRQDLLLRAGGITFGLGVAASASLLCCGDLSVHNALSASLLTQRLVALWYGCLEEVGAFWDGLQFLHGHGSCAV